MKPLKLSVQIPSGKISVEECRQQCRRANQPAVEMFNNPLPSLSVSEQSSSPSGNPA